MTRRGGRYGINMPKKTWTRNDYMRMIGLEKKRKKKPKKKDNSLAEAIMLSKLVGNSNRNKAQRLAVIDSLNSRQMVGMGRLVKIFIKSKYPLPENKIKQLVRDKKFISAFFDNKVPVDTRKRILSQKGGVLGFVLPLAANLLGGLLGGR